MEIEQNLHEKSKSYYQEADIYEQFSHAEDFPGMVSNFLVPQVVGKKVLDLGCGTGKYLKLLSPYVESLVGLDRSSSQLGLAGLKIKGAKNVNLLVSDASAIPLPNNQFDVVMSCWVIGTIQDIQKQETVIKEAERVLKPGGKIYLVENAYGSEFERIRDRVDDPLQRTQLYNSWLTEKMGFAARANLESYFQFNNIDLARKVFGSIWGERVEGMIKDRKIAHTIVVLEKKIEKA